MRLLYLTFWIVFIVLLFVDEYAAYSYVPFLFGLYYFLQLHRIHKFNSVQEFIGFVVFPILCLFNYFDVNNVFIQIVFGLSEIGMIAWLSHRVVSLIRRESLGLSIPLLLEVLYLCCFPLNLFDYKEKLDFIREKKKDQ
jgi:hypothetical protein